MPFFGKIVNNVLHGKNNFCSLCFKIDQNIVIHQEINIAIDETEQIVALSDILRSVFGNEVQEYLSIFDNICEHCQNFIIGIYKYIRTCHNNAKSLMQALDGLNNNLSCTKDENGKSNSLFVTMNLQNFTSKLRYSDLKLETTMMALKQYNLLNTPKTQLTSVTSNSAKVKKNDAARIKTLDMLLDPHAELAKCKECLKTYRSLYSLRTHYLRVHLPKNYKCSQCSKTFRLPSSVAYHKSVEHCQCICSKCGKVFNNKYAFMRHELSHHLQFVCSDCGRVYKSIHTYKRHIKANVCKREGRANPANAKYTCDYCGKKYTQKMSLRVHIQYVHGNYKAHECNWCNKKFWAQSKLKAHIVKHTKEKKFTCSLCQGKFVTKESLLYHTRIHTGEKPYSCSQCKCTFLSSSRRAYHMKTYHLRAKVECDSCHSKFTSLAYLDKHKKLHKECQNIQNDTGEKPVVKQKSAKSKNLVVQMKSIVNAARVTP